MSLPLLTLLALGQVVTVDLAPGVSLPVHGTSPAIAYNGQDFVVSWVDDRRSSLAARRFTPLQAHELLWVVRPGMGATVRTACELGAPPRAVLVNDQAGELTAWWFDTRSAMSVVGWARLRPDGGSDCPPPFPVQTEPFGELRAVRTPNSTLLAWRRGTDVVGTWFNGTSLSNPLTFVPGAGASAQVSIGAVPSGARLAFTDSTQVSRYVNIPEGSTPMSMPFAFFSNVQRLALDPRGDYALSFTGMGWFGTPLDGGTPANLSIGGPGTASLVSSDAGRVLALERASDVVVTKPEAPGVPVFLPPERDVGLATDGVDALLVSTEPTLGDVRVREVTMSALAVGVPEAVARVPPNQRQPSLAWVTDRWVVVYEEWDTARFMPRVTEVAPDGSVLVRVALSPSLVAPALVTRPTGEVLLRVDDPMTGATRTTTLLLDLMTGLVTQGPLVASSFVTSPAGGASELTTWQWNNAQLSTNTNGSVPFPGGTSPTTSSAALGGGLWLPLRGMGDNLQTLFVADSPLPMPLPAPQLAHGRFDPNVTPAIAASTSGPPRLLLAWAQPDAGVAWKVFRPDGGAMSTGTLPVASPRSVAVAPSAADWVLAYGNSTNVWLARVFDDGGAVTFAVRADDEAGELVAASAPTGQVAVAWPVLSRERGSVALKLALVEPGLPDAGARDAGVDAGVDAGAPDAGAQDGGLDGGSDGGRADAGGDAGAADGGPAMFTTAGCGCTAGGEGAWLALLVLVLVLALRRRG